MNQLKQLSFGRRKAISLSPAELINTTTLYPENLLSLIIQPTVEGLNLALWASQNRELIKTHLLKHGGILFRNFQVQGVADFEQFIQAVAGELLEYSYRSTPRSHVSGNIYTSTEYPSDQFIPLHNEMAYTSNWPMKIAFYCVKKAQQGGATPIADSRKVFERIDPIIRERFRQKEVMYVRNYSDGLDLSWQNVFQTTNKSVVESYCHHAGIEFEWKDNNHLKTRQICQGVSTHPQTREMVWFNQAHLFHISSLESAVRESILAGFKEEDIPRNAYYGDSSPIETAVLDAIREVYKQETIIFTWKEGDVLLLDNMLTAHGRQPFVGNRKILTGMAEVFSSKDI